VSTFTCFDHDLMDSTAANVLKPTSRALLYEVVRRIKADAAMGQGELFGLQPVIFSYGSIAWSGCERKSFYRALADLEAHGFVKVHKVQAGRPSRLEWSLDWQIYEPTEAEEKMLGRHEAEIDRKAELSARREIWIRRKEQRKPIAAKVVAAPQEERQVVNLAPSTLPNSVESTGPKKSPVVVPKCPTYQSQNVPERIRDTKTTPPAPQTGATTEGILDWRKIPELKAILERIMAGSPHYARDFAEKLAIDQFKARPSSGFVLAWLECKSFEERVSVCVQALGGDYRKNPQRKKVVKAFKAAKREFEGWEKRRKYASKAVRAAIVKMLDQDENERLRHPLGGLYYRAVQEAELLLKKGEPEARTSPEVDQRVQDTVASAAERMAI